jgi:hypothetical protein
MAGRLKLDETAMLALTGSGFVSMSTGRATAATILQHAASSMFEMDTTPTLFF